MGARQNWKPKEKCRALGGWGWSHGTGGRRGFQLALFCITAAATSPAHSVVGGSEDCGVHCPETGPTAQLVLQFFNFKNNFALPTYVWSKISSVNIYNKTTEMNTEDYKKRGARHKNQKTAAKPKLTAAQAAIAAAQNWPKPKRRSTAKKHSRNTENKNLNEYKWGSFCGRVCGWVSAWHTAGNCTKMNCVVQHLMLKYKCPAGRDSWPVQGCSNWVRGISMMWASGDLPGFPFFSMHCQFSSSTGR